MATYLVPGVIHWLTLSTLMFSIGIYGLLTRKNAVAILISTELMLNAVVLNFAVFNRFIAPNAIEGELMSIFIIAVAAAEAVVGMAIFVAMFKHSRTLDVTHIDVMKG